MFTSTPLAGNGLAVVHDADGLDEATMLGVARETAQSETTFVQTATVEGADYRNRIFTMDNEIRFAGHPSLGTAVAVARAQGVSEARYMQQTGAGVQPVEVELRGDVAHAAMLQEPARFGDAIEAAPVLGALGLGPADAHPELPVQPVSTGIFHLMVPVRDRVALERARPNLQRVEAIEAQTDTMILYMFVADGDGDAEPVRARGFLAERHHVLEDPATGSAAGPLCAYLHRHTGRSAATVVQGVELGRPSRLETAMAGDHVRVAGDCVVVLDGRLRV
ncbi:MAG TPA: PhzF family phenazine biosynthesis protein [Baekduia sp.]|nr:PhzF family phenazine biosynthesis protein [Baekduia sp.]